MADITKFQMIDDFIFATTDLKDENGNVVYRRGVASAVNAIVISCRNTIDSPISQHDYFQFTKYILDCANRYDFDLNREVPPDECHFSSGICETLTCCRDGIFDKMGYPVNECPQFPCLKYKRCSDVVNNINGEDND